jgi:DME family drug/metabolite transporter
MSARLTAPGPAQGTAALRGLLLVCTAALLWGTVGVAGRLLSAPAIDPALMGWSRTLLGGLALLAIARLSGWSSQYGKASVAPLLLFGVSCAVFQVTLFTGFREVGVTVTVAVTVVLPPILVAAAAALVQPHARSLSTAAAVTVGALGVGLSLSGSPDLLVKGYAFGWFGAALLTVNSLAFIGMATALRRLAGLMHPVQAAGMGLLTASIILLPAMHIASREVAVVTTLTWLSARDLALLLYTGVAATGGAYAAFTAGMKLCPRPAVGFAATMIEPVFAALLAALLIGEALTPVAIAGCLLLLAAMGLLFVSELKAQALPGKGQSQGTPLVLRRHPASPPAGKAASRQVGAEDR